MVMTAAVREGIMRRRMTMRGIMRREMIIYKIGRSCCMRLSCWRQKDPLFNSKRIHSGI